MPKRSELQSEEHSNQFNEETYIRSETEKHADSIDQLIEDTQQSAHDESIVQTSGDNDDQSTIKPHTIVITSEGYWL